MIEAIIRIELKGVMWEHRMMSNSRTGIIGAERLEASAREIIERFPNRDRKHARLFIMDHSLPMGQRKREVVID